jgi:transposase InsO family protein
MDTIEPHDRGEEIAVFRAGIIGSLAHADLQRGDLKRHFEALSKQKFRPPQSDRTRTYGVSTLQRWYYAYKKGGLDALRPKRRADRGHGRELSSELKELLLDIRREHRNVPATVIRDTLIAEGRLDPQSASISTVQRLYREHGLSRLPRGVAPEDGAHRLRWEAPHPGALWHGDVCHGRAITIGGQTRPLRIHALMDDASRYVVALEARHTEREIDMIRMLADALRKHPCPGALYLDNGPTYRGEALSVACSRMEVGLIHAKPYDPQARGKMERFWRTLRERCLDHLSGCASLHDVNVRLWAFLDSYYHRREHASLIGRTPRQVWTSWWNDHDPVEVDEEKLREALTVRKRRRVRNDSTLGHAGGDWEVDGVFLSSSLVTVAHCLLDDPPRPWIEHENRRIDLHPVDPKRNASRRRRKHIETHKTTDFDPATTLLDQTVGRKPEED